MGTEAREVGEISTQDKLQDLRNQFKCSVDDRAISELISISQFLLEDQLKNPIDTQSIDNLLARINSWNKEVAKRLKQVGCNFEEPKEYRTLEDAENDPLEKAIDSYFNSRGYYFGYEDFLVGEDLVFASTLRKIDEERSVDIKSYFSDWNKYFPNIPSVQIPIVFFGHDETDTAFKMHQSEQQIWHGTHNEKGIQIFRGDYNRFIKRVDPSISLKILFHEEQNTVADEMGHAFFKEALGFEAEYGDSTDAEITFEFNGNSASVFQLNELCSMLSRFRFGTSFVANLEWLLVYGPAETSAEQYSFGRDFLISLFHKRMIELGISDTFAYVDYCKKLPEEKLDEEKKLVISRAENIFFTKMVPSAKRAIGKMKK